MFMKREDVNNITKRKLHGRLEMLNFSSRAVVKIFHFKWVFTHNSYNNNNIICYLHTITL